MFRGGFRPGVVALCLLVIFHFLFQCKKQRELSLPITGANSLWSSTVLADSGGRSCSSRAGFLLGRSWRSEARLRFLSILSDGILSCNLEWDQWDADTGEGAVVEYRIGEKIIKSWLAKKGGEQKSLKAVETGNWTHTKWAKIAAQMARFLKCKLALQSRNREYR